MTTVEGDGLDDVLEGRGAGHEVKQVQGVEDVQVEEAEHRDHKVKAVVDEDTVLDEEQEVEHLVLKLGVAVSKD